MHRFPRPGGTQTEATPRVDRDKSEFLTIGLVGPPEHVEKQDQFGTLSTKTKFKLSVKTMSDPITVSFLGAIALMGRAATLIRPTARASRGTATLAFLP